MESFDDFLINHPCFIKKNSYSQMNEYRFKGKLSIEIDKQFDVKQIEPIGWDSYYSDIFELHEAPLWFLQLYKKTFEEYYKKNRLRYKVNHIKFPMGTLVEAYCLVQEGHLFYHYLKYFQNEQRQLVIYIKEDFEKELEEVVQYLQSFDYIVIDKKSKNRNIYYYIN